jgi:hypothetical protein
LKKGVVKIGTGGRLGKLNQVSNLASGTWDREVLLKYRCGGAAGR